MIARGSFIAATASAISAAVGAGAFSRAALAQVAAEATFSPQGLHDDIDFFWQTLLEVGAKPFATSKREDVERTCATIKAGITTPLNQREFFLRAAPMFAALNDGHVGLALPRYYAEVANGLSIFPLRVVYDGNELAINRTDAGLAAAGSTLVSVDGVPSSQLKTELAEIVSAQTPVLRRYRAAAALPYLLYAKDGPKSEFDVVFVTPNGARTHEVLEAAPPPKAPATTPAEPYSYSTLAEGRVGYIDYRRCEDEARFKSFLVDTFSAIKAGNVRALIVDVRNNAGGNSNLNNDLWPYASDKPFKQFGGVIVHSSDRLKREYGRAKFVQLYGDQAWSAPGGTNLSYDSGDGDLVEPGQNPLRFGGRTLLLIGTATFSSGLSCAAAAKDYGLATLVGEETGEPCNSTGEVYATVAPNSGLRAFFTTKYFLAPRPHPEGQGIIPDVLVRTTMADRLAKRDPVLERAIVLAG